MYSFQPVPYYPDSHFGFWLVLVIVAILWITATSQLSESGCLTCQGVITAFLAFILFIAYQESYHAVAPRNERFEAVRVGFEAEGFRRQSGKTTTNVHVLYVGYQVPEGVVYFQATEGAVYPERAILYKN